MLLVLDATSSLSHRLVVLTRERVPWSTRKRIFTKKDEIDTALGYFEDTPRMCYHWFRQCDLFVASVVAEASYKTVICERLKQAGRHWTVNGADAIIALGCQQVGSTWETACKQASTQTRTA
jgi:hypothetical protein